MLKNYLKIAFRNLKKYKGYSFINIAGLAIGMAACITIFAFVKNAYSHDSFNKKADRIYRVNVEAKLNNKNAKVALTPAPLGPYLKDKFPQIKDVVRLLDMQVFSSMLTPVIKYNGKILRANHFILADSSFFNVFSFKMVMGNPNTALNSPFKVVLTKDAARKLFGNEDPVGKTITYNDKFTFTVTGVVDNPSPNSTIQFDYLGSLNSLPSLWGVPGILKSTFQFNYYTYLLLNRNTQIGSIEKQAPHELEKYWGEKIKSMFGTPNLYFEKLCYQYWDNNVRYDIPIKGKRSTVAAFAIIAVIILLIACANFINLSTARALTRAKEIGVRKAIGGQRSQIIKQLMIESTLTSLIALFSAIALSEFFIPVINKLLEKSLSVDYLHNINIILIVLGILILTNLLSGLLPALFLSSFKPVSTLTGNMNDLKERRYGSRFFILFQFSAVIALTICTIIVANQYDLLEYQNIGFNKNNIIILKYNQGIDGSYIPFKQTLLENPHILGITASEQIPGNLFPKGPRYFRGESGVKQLMFSFCSVDPDFIKVFDIKLRAGRNFTWGDQKNKLKEFILNETAVKQIGWTSKKAIGKPFDYSADSIKGQVIGVLHDFNFQSLRSKVEPLVLEMGVNSFQNLAVKVSSNDIAGSLGYIEKTWTKMFPNDPIQYNFLDKSLDALYKSEQKMSILFTWFSLLAIVIACLGLYGLVLYTARRKNKEIGVRKVLGASVHGLIFILIKEFAKWVLIANIIAWPVAYYVMNKWLQTFAYRININWWVFVIAGGIALVIALATVSFQAVRAATANPVKSLRYE